MSGPSGASGLAALERASRRDLAPWAALAVAVVAISTSAILVKEADASGVTIAFWRNLLGALALAPFAVRAWRRDHEVADRLRTHARPMVFAGIALGLHFTLWLEGLLRTTVAASVTLVTMSPIFVAAGTAFVLRERVRGWVWPGVLVAVAGAVVVGWVGVESTETASDPTLGNLLSFGGAATIAVYILIGRQVRVAGVPTVVYGAVVYFLAALVVLPIVVIRGEALLGLSGQTWLALAGMVIGPQLLGHTMINFTLERLSPTIVSVSTLLEPLGSGLLAWWLLAEVPNSGFWWGAPLAIGGLTVTVWASRS